MLVALLLWRVETLPTLQEQTRTQQAGSDSQGREQSIPLPAREEQGSGSEGGAFFIDLARMEQLLTEHCVAPQLYLQHDLTLQQLAQAIGTNRYYLSQYFSHQGITYNTYINNLRINHFITLYQKATVAGQSVGAQQLAQESGFRSYSTFGRAFTQRMGQSVTAWMRDTAE